MSRHRRKKYLRIKYSLFALAFIAFALFIVFGGTTEEDYILDYIDGRTTREMLTHFETTGVNSPLSATVHPMEITLTFGNTTHRLTDYHFYVSIAPTLNEEQACLIRHVTGDVGTMPNTTFDITITDRYGHVAYNGQKTTQDNGFLSFWLPRDESFTIDITHRQYQGTFDFTTTDDSSTCLMNFRLLPFQ